MKLFFSYNLPALHSDQFKPKSYLKLIKKYIFSEGEQFPLRYDANIVAHEICDGN